MRILYDPEYNFHVGYNKHIIESLPSVDWRKGRVVNFFESNIRGDSGHPPDDILNLGYFLKTKKIDYIFSPHILLLSDKPWFIEVEDIRWLFTDKYGTIRIDRIPKWKSRIAITLLVSPNCIGIIAWSRYAISTIKLFLSNYASPEESRVIIKKTSIVYPKIEFEKEKRVIGYDGFFKIIYAQPFKEYESIRKGWNIALKTLLDERVREISNSVQVTLVGVVNKREIAQLKKHGFKVSVFDILPHTQFLKILSNQNVILFPSRAETFGVVIAESIEKNVIPICNYGPNVKALGEIVIHKSNGFLIPCKKSGVFYDEPNVEKFASTLKNLINRYPYFSKKAFVFNKIKFAANSVFSKKHTRSTILKMLS